MSRLVAGIASEHASEMRARQQRAGNGLGVPPMPAGWVPPEGGPGGDEWAPLAAEVGEDGSGAADASAPLSMLTHAELAQQLGVAEDDMPLLIDIARTHADMDGVIDPAPNV